MKQLALLMASLLFAVALPVAAAPTPVAVRTEIDGLLTRLASSGCEFKRNGSWHQAGEAKAHLERKLTYIEKRGDLSSIEQFIKLAATGSSMSGTPYQVRCAGTEPVPSAQWLGDALKQMRMEASLVPKSATSSPPAAGAASKP